jgi:DNA-binding CsgD family transcriptional regulator
VDGNRIASAQSFEIWLASGGATCSPPTGFSSAKGDLMNTQSENESPPRALQITPLDRQVLQQLANGDTADDVVAGLGMSGPEMRMQLTKLFARAFQAAQVSGPGAQGGAGQAPRTKPPARRNIGTRDW